MKRVFYIVKKELWGSRKNLAFHIIVVIAPLMFLILWLIALAQEVTLRVSLIKPETDPSFAAHLIHYSTPAGIPYFNARTIKIRETDNAIAIQQAISGDESGISGKLVLNLKNIDRNMTKNYRNRLTGAVASYIEKTYLQSRAIAIIEKPMHKQDILWKRYFTASLFVMGLIMGGLLYGAFALSSEWRSGTIELLSLAPQHPAWLLLGKQVAIVIKGLISSGIFIVVAFFMVPGLSMDIAGVSATAFAGYWIIGLAGMLVGTGTRDPIICFLISLIGSLALWLLGNGFGTMAIVGSVGGFFTAINPATYFAEAVQYFINGTPANWSKIILVWFCWFIILQGALYQVYRHKIYLPGGKNP